MGLFTKKFDLKNDHLAIRFDPTKKQYQIYYGREIISNEKLNRKTQKVLAARNQDLVTNPEILQQEIDKLKEIERFNKLAALGYTCGSFEYLGPNNGSMSNNMEKYLNKLVSEEDILLGIHRVGNITPAMIEDILENGLIMAGHLGGMTSRTAELSNNVSYYADNKKIIKELMYADNYKNSTGSLLIKIPDQDLTKDIYITDQNGNRRLNPKYILGYVPLENNHHIEKIITAKDIVQAKDQNNNTVTYSDYLLEEYLLGENTEEQEHKISR